MLSTLQPVTPFLQGEFYSQQFSIPNVIIAFCRGETHGWSLPSNRCENTAPTPDSDASTSTTTVGRGSVAEGWEQKQTALLAR